MMSRRHPDPSIGKAPRWFVAELVFKIAVAGDDRNVAHKNLMLIGACSGDEAYDKALALGQAGEISYENPQNKKVQIRFMGLSRLMAVNDPLQDGAELLYEEEVGISDQQIGEWIVPKHLLTVFRKIEPSPGPDYSSAEVLEEASRMISRGK